MFTEEDSEREKSKRKTKNKVYRRHSRMRDGSHFLLSYSK